MPDLAQVLRYIVVGAGNTAFGFSVILLCMYALGMPPAAANATGFIAGFFLSYTTHRRLTFRSSVDHRQGLPAFLVVTLIGYAANMAMLLGALGLGLHVILAQAMAMATHVVITFFLHASFVFAKRG